MYLPTARPCSRPTVHARRKWMPTSMRENAFSVAASDKRVNVRGAPHVVLVQTNVFSLDDRVGLSARTGEKKQAKAHHDGGRFGERGSEVHGRWTTLAGHLLSRVAHPPYRKKMRAGTPELLDGSEAFQRCRSVLLKPRTQRRNAMQEACCPEAIAQSLEQNRKVTSFFTTHSRSHSKDWFLAGTIQLPANSRESARMKPG